ncbi:hypothetical protein [Terriglobus aquaticus]|uniref:Uncharacterized protein n=1 Tax=Terriglobus aquaticus TaxID=940139 RepID=A0ABW9KHD2_9BACT|nr:hypothetical protein [Terriglobus aquaticus]
MSRQFLLGVAFVALIIFLLWGPLRRLVFGASAGRGAAGEWVGTITITDGYPRPAEGTLVRKPLATPLHGAVYVKLSTSDGFMQEYSGPGQIHLKGHAEDLAFRLGSFRIHPPEIRAQGAFLCKGLLEDGVTGTYQPNAIHIEHRYSPGTMDGSVAFTIDLHRGSESDYQQLQKSLP